MSDPVTITRSTSAAAAGAPANPDGAPTWAAGGGGAPAANAFDARIKGNPTLATRAMRTNPSLSSTFFIISFSIGLVRFRSRLLNFGRPDKLFFHFFSTFFERL